MAADWSRLARHRLQRLSAVSEGYCVQTVTYGWATSYLIGNHWNLIALAIRRHECLPASGSKNIASLESTKSLTRPPCFYWLSNVNRRNVLDTFKRYTDNSQYCRQLWKLTRDMGWVSELPPGRKHEARYRTVRNLPGDDIHRGA